jgi:AcrR family transcriptional regulator
MVPSSSADDVAASLEQVHPLLLVALPGLVDAVAPPAVLSHDRARLDPDEVLASQRWRLLLATAQTMAAEGYAAATIERITTEAGVSKKTFYKFFASKEEAFLACYDAIEPALEFVVESAQGPDTATGMVEAVVSNYLAMLAAAPALTRLFLFEALTATPTIRARRSATIAQLADAVGELIEEQRPEAPGAPVLDRAQLVALLGGVNELCVEHLVTNEPDTLPTLTPTIVQFVLRVLGVAPAGGN